MVDLIKIEGGKKLKGTVRIDGAKNATVALIPAVILADGLVTLDGIPDISDVYALAHLLEVLNAKVKFEDKKIIIDPSNLKNIELEEDAVSKLRASYYFMGALLGKYKEVTIKMPGGCYLGPRPIDLHLKGFELLGAKVEMNSRGYHIKADKLIGNTIYLDIASVGATINIMFAAVKATGKTIIENAAKEPEIIDVANLLTKMGAKIRGAGTDTITIEGVENLHGCFHEIIPDRIEAGTYLIIAAAAAQEVTVENIIPHHLESLLSKLKEMNVNMEIQNDRITIRGGNELKPTSVKTQVYPGFPTDLQQPLTALLTLANGQSKIQEKIFPERFLHCGQLNMMQSQINHDSGLSLINGPTKLNGTKVEATDLRCGACLVVAGLIANGITTIDNVLHIDRGYSNIVEKLTNIGAKIWREPKI